MLGRHIVLVVPSIHDFFQICQIPHRGAAAPQNYQIFSKIARCRILEFFVSKTVRVTMFALGSLFEPVSLPHSGFFQIFWIGGRGAAACSIFILWSLPTYFFRKRLSPTFEKNFLGTRVICSGDVLRSLEPKKNFSWGTPPRTTRYPFFPPSLEKVAFSTVANLQIFLCRKL